MSGKFLAAMTNDLQVYDLQSRQVVVVRCCLDLSAPYAPALVVVVEEVVVVLAAVVGDYGL